MTVTKSKGQHYIYSTLSSDQRYVKWSGKAGGGPYTAQKEVLLNGEANVVNRKHLMTPKGAVTEVSTEQLTFLKTIDAFNKHVKGGYLTIETRSENPDVVAKDMTPKDKAAPKTPEDYKKAGQPTPVINKKAG